MAYNETKLIATANQTTLTLGSSGNVTGLVSTPRITSISFDSGSNALGSYIQHGTFTPTIQGSTVPGTITYAAQLGHYSRVGYICFFYLRVSYTAAVLSTGTLQILGLPFNPKNLGTNGTPIFSATTSNIAFDTGYTFIVGAFSGTAAILNLYEAGSSKAFQAIAIPVPGSQKSFSICGKYIIDGA